MINVYVISGFLGSGKTTFIQKLLKEKKFEKVMLLENELGEIGVDGAFFDKNLSVKEINNGCICCSLQGDFEEALHEVEQMGVSDLIIEPSGVGKLSDILDVIEKDDDFRVVSHICIVDVKTCRKYHVNFKEYFDDQVVSANTIVLSHLDVADEEKVKAATEMLREINSDATITDKPVDEYDIDELMDLIVKDGEICLECYEHHHHHHHHDDEECCCHHHHHHHDDDDNEDEECCCHHHHDDEECCCHDDEECECHHHHHHDDEEDEHHHHHHHHHHDDDDDEDEDFKSVAIRPSYHFSKEELETILDSMPEDIIRVKGYVLSDSGTLYFNYVLNEYNIFDGENRDEALVLVIGSTVDKKAMRELFHE